MSLMLLSLLELFSLLLFKLLISSSLKPNENFFCLFFIYLSKPSKAPPQINNIFVVSTLINFCSGFLLPPSGDTLTIVPSNNFNKACCTPSPLTSLVIETFSPFLPILSISSIYTIPFSANLGLYFATCNNRVNIDSTSSPT